MITRERVLSILQMRGPSIPVQVKKALGEGDTFMIGAVLTELREAGKVKVSNTKRGGSPFYYVPEHAAKLTQFIDDLPEKDARAARLLQEQKVLQDTTQEPLTRVCLRQIKDFAIPIEVNLAEGKQLFWKWYLVPREEAEQRIRQTLGLTQPTPAKQAETKAATPEQQPPDEKKPEPIPLQKEPEEKQPVSAHKLLKEQDDTGDEFLKQVLHYFADKHIQVITKNILRKNSDIEFEVSVPSAVGRMDYYCKAKSKKKNNDGDLSAAYVQGQLKKLPVLYITTGEVTKKAKEKLQREFKGLTLIQL